MYTLPPVQRVWRVVLQVETACIVRSVIYFGLTCYHMNHYTCRLVFLLNLPTAVISAAHLTYCQACLVLNCEPVNVTIRSPYFLVRAWCLTLRQCVKCLIGLDSVWHCYIPWKEELVTWKLATNPTLSSMSLSSSAYMKPLQGKGVSWWLEKEYLVRLLHHGWEEFDGRQPLVWF